MLSENYMVDLAETRDDPSAFSELVFGSPLHAGQERYAAHAQADVNFLLPGNSWGKTEFIMRNVMWDAWFKRGAFTPTNPTDWLQQSYKALVASYSYPIAKESFERLTAAIQARPEVSALVAKVTSSDPARVTLTNGSVIDWGSLDGQGKSVEAARRRVIYVDEVGHIPDISLTFDNILFPRTMGVGGRIHLFGTPKATSDPYLLEVYEKGRLGDDPFYYSQAGSVFENEFWPSPERERLLANPRYVRGWRPCGDCQSGDCGNLLCRNGQTPILTPIGRQVINGEFIIAGGYFFDRRAVARIFTGVEEEPETDGEDHFHFDPEPGHLYLGAFDLGGNRARRKGKRESDATVGFVVDYTKRPWRIVCFDYIRGGTATWNEKYEIMASRFRDYRMPYLLVDATGNQDSVVEALYDRGVDAQGVQFGGSGHKKYDMLRNLQLCMELEWDGHLGVLRSPPIPELKGELDHYVWPDDDIKQDCVFALGMALHEIAQWELPAAVGGEVF